jgi:subtilisin-like proprotein convertase family protein
MKEEKAIDLINGMKIQATMRYKKSSSKKRWIKIEQTIQTHYIKTLRIQLFLIRLHAFNIM